MIGKPRAFRLSLLLFVILLAGLLIPASTHFQTRPLRSIITASVFDDDGPVVGAQVRFSNQRHGVETDARGRACCLGDFGQSTRVTFSKDGYFIAGTTVLSSHVAIRLKKLPAVDDEDYAWVEPAPDPSHPQNCGNCHEAIYQEWSASGHSRSVRNRHFLNLYDGSDWSGGRKIGWNLLAENPDGVGVCTACHAPSVRFDDPAYYDLRKAHGPSSQGVHCDYCHKVARVADVTFGLTHGRFSLELLRPAKGQLFFGPLDDVDRGEDAYSPVYHESRYCAGCHEGTVFGVPVYTTYSEWLQSPAYREGKQCQSCHMSPTGRLTNIAPGKGGRNREPQTLGNHRFFAGSQVDTLQRCLNVSIRIRPRRPGLCVEVSITAEQVGHRVPTGFIDRHLILAVEATDDSGKAIAPASKTPVLTEEAGATLVGLPGRLFAKVLSDSEGRHPVPFWRAQPRVIDTRLLPGIADRRDYFFAEPGRRVRVRLLYRRFWEEIAHDKGWPDNEVVVLDESLEVPTEGERIWHGN